MATIGRSRAILESHGLKLSGLFAWLAWRLVHIYYLSGFRNRLLVLIQWAWSYLTYSRGARLNVEKNWQSFAKQTNPEAPKPRAAAQLGGAPAKPSPRPEGEARTP
jgi:NADH dehydrogenase